MDAAFSILTAIFLLALGLTLANIVWEWLNYD